MRPEKGGWFSEWYTRAAKRSEPPLVSLGCCLVTGRAKRRHKELKFLRSRFAMLLNPEILQSSRCRRSKRRKSNGPQAVGCRRSTKETGNDGGGKACTYLKTGGLEDGKYQTNEAGSAQGNIISPVLANIYMHHVLVL